MNTPSHSGHRKIAPALTLFMIAAVSAYGYPQASDDSPKAVIEKINQMAMDGQFLSPRGWKRLGEFYLRPTPQAHDQSVGLISRNFSIELKSLAGEHADVYVGYIDLGTFDPALRYTPPDSRVMKWATMYHLKLTAYFWQPIEGGAPPKKVAAPLAWRIENDPYSAWTGIDAAIEYVTERTQKESDPKVVKNAEATLAELKKLQQQENRP